MIQFSFELNDVNGKEIWIRLQVFKINVLDLEKKVYIYGSVKEEFFGKIIGICSEYGELTIIVNKRVAK